MILLRFLLLIVFLTAAIPSHGADKPITILFTSDVKGRIAPAG